jgi:hypothetical protein
MLTKIKMYNNGYKEPWNQSNSEQAHRRMVCGWDASQVEAPVFIKHFPGREALGACMCTYAG